MCSLLLLALVAATGCAAGNAGSDLDHLPKLSDIRSENPQPRIRGPWPEGQRPDALVLSVETWYPLSRDLETALELLEEDAIDPRMVALWKANGIRVGTIDARAQTVARFERKLGPHLFQRGTRSRLVINDPDTTLPLMRNQALRPGIEMQWLERPGQGDYLGRTLSRGRFQLLARLWSSPQRGTVIELEPHLHVPRRRFEQPDLLAQALEGEAFEALTLSLPAEPGRVIIIAYQPVLQPRRPIARGPDADRPDRPMQQQARNGSQAESQRPSGQEPRGEFDLPAGDGQLWDEDRSAQDGPIGNDTEPDAADADDQPDADPHTDPEEAADTADEQAEADSPEPQPQPQRQQPRLRTTIGRLLLTGPRAGQEAQAVIMIRHAGDLPRSTPAAQAPTDPQHEQAVPPSDPAAP